MFNAFDNVNIYKILLVVELDAEVVNSNSDTATLLQRHETYCLCLCVWQCEQRQSKNALDIRVSCNFIDIEFTFQRLSRFSFGNAWDRIYSNWFHQVVIGLFNVGDFFVYLFVAI